MFTSFSRRSLLAGGLAVLGGLHLSRPARAAGPSEIGVDYAYYNPPSLILRKFGWLEESLKPLGTRVEWVLSVHIGVPIRTQDENPVATGAAGHVHQETEAGGIGPMKIVKQNCHRHGIGEGPEEAGDFPEEPLLVLLALTIRGRGRAHNRTR